MLKFGEQTTSYWSDPTAPTVDGLMLGLWFHTFVGVSDEAFSLA
jgi:CRISPR-associated protein Cas5t